MVVNYWTGPLTFADFSFDFSGWRNLTHFITLAQKYNLLVNIRPGPYIDAEFEFGGLPWWLLKYDNIELRAWNPT
jgi:beta-galactosidase